MKNYSSGEFPKIGDVVRCINPPNGYTESYYLPPDSIHTVFALSHDCVYIKGEVDDPNDDGYYPTRFDLVSRKSDKLVNNQIKLHLGCNDRKIHGYINIDGRVEVKPDKVEDVFTLPSFEKNTISVIYLCHVLEHASRADAQQAISRYYDLLQEGGVLRISVPDFDALCRHYIIYQDLEYLENMLDGKQGHKYDFHYSSFDFKYLEKLLLNVGFKSVHRYDPSKTEHSHVDDHSFSFYPHMDRNGMMLSLNVEAIK